ncbi:hypothetical protein PIB30_003528 [Stylosanthes scabra]|uniref:SAP domain-containing protein n=1 Tax=Stylosanthes scabra TaxID=79078 RepID=A0ABU6W2Z9_9FABA|nr:hypothetical protein [Stylosanthes scabra]
MSSRYPILDNRPIHQWKVTELKEELKRRRLTTKGLKDDLVRRLDEALRAEMEAEAAESASKDDANGFEVHEGGGGEDSRTGTTDVGVVQTIEGEGVQTVQSMEKGDNDNVESIQVVETVEKGNTVVVEPIDTENAEKIQEDVDVDDDSKNDKQRSVANPVDINSSVSAMDEDTEQTGLSAGVDPANVKDEQSAHASTVETSVKIIETVSTEVVVSDQDSHSAVKSNLDSAIKVENEESKLQLDIEVPKPQLECDTKPPSEDLVPNTSVPENQVSEVNPSLGSQVKSDSISSDSVSINQKNELKDTIITDNVKLEQDIVRPEMVEEPSSRKDEPVYDESHSMDVGGLLEKKASVEENSNNVTTPDLNKTNSSDDVGYPEKLNLDRSSGDDSMEEDLPENKQVDSKFDVDEKDKVENIEDIDMSPVALAEKRKFNEQVSFGSNEPAKRQRRWNTETVKGSDLESTVPRAATTPKDEPVALKRNFSRSDSTVTDDAPKERIVPPSQKPPTNSLRIDRFLRPFTLKAVQELLGKTGSVSSFWMDQIKTHCYVTYASVEEAIETRNAVYNLQWPPNGGRLLVAEFVDPQEVKMKLEPPPPPPSAPVIPAPAILPTPPYSQPEPSPRMRREHPPAPATLPPPPPLSKLPPAARERLPSPPPLPEKVDPPILTLDDLFRKTTATPRIYYLPLSEEQVAAKLAARSKSTRL